MFGVPLKPQASRIALLIILRIGLHSKVVNNLVTLRVIFTIVNSRRHTGPHNPTPADAHLRAWPLSLSERGISFWA